MPNGCKRDIDKQDIDFGNGLGGGRNGMLGGNMDGWMGGELENFLQSTRTLLVEECVLRQTLEGRKRRRCGVGGQGGDEGGGGIGGIPTREFQHVSVNIF